ncbi:MAG: cytotoxic translational repressor of toxin-antitoxin stability system [Candidatus Dormibacteria bacterium]
MSRWPAPTRADHDEFCRAEGWRRVRDARGRTGTHHLTYELVLPDGRILRTRVSHPADRTAYGPSLWAHILRDQLDVDEATFWACVRDGVRPERGADPAPPENAIPADVVSLLLHRVGLTQAEVAALTREAAVERLNRFWLEGR